MMLLLQSLLTASYGIDESISTWLHRLKKAGSALAHHCFHVVKVLISDTEFIYCAEILFLGRSLNLQMYPKYCDDNPSACLSFLLFPLIEWLTATASCYQHQSCSSSWHSLTTSVLSSSVHFPGGIPSCLHCVSVLVLTPFQWTFFYKHFQHMSFRGHSLQVFPTDVQCTIPTGTSYSTSSGQ